MEQRREFKLGRVAVLGAGGCVGSRLVEMLHLSAWANVVPVVRRVTAMAGLSRFPLDTQLADVREQDALVQALKG